MTERPEDAMTETTTLREMAHCLAVNEPDATYAEHLSFLQEAAAELGLSEDPNAVLSDEDATTVLEAHARETEDADDAGDADAEYDRLRDAELGL
jgi:hypothetical protein